MNHPAGGLDERWREQLALDPAAPALHFGKVVFSRADFEAEIGRQRSAFVAAGLGAGHVVAWLGSNSPSMIAALFACERIGAVLLPLNWRLAAAELGAIVRHGGASRVFASAEHQALADRLQADLEPGADTEPGDLLLAYTSGTTGRPKGALHTAARMRANAEAATAVQRIDTGTRALASLPLFHVGGLCIQTLPTLLAGGVVLLQPRFETAAWFDDVAQWRPSTTVLVPATMQALVSHPRWAAADLASLKFVNSGSQVVPRRLIDAFHARGVPVAQVYGATETGPVSIALDPDQAFAHPGKAGRAVPGVAIRLVGADGAALAPGAAGEVLVSGPNVMRGYHREHDHPSFRGGWFHSGDLARVDADGFFEVVGRASELIISGGENIYPAEIENLVAALDGVADCAVVGLPDARWGEVPVLVVVAAAGAKFDPAAVRAALEGRLARFKQPQRIVLLDVLPKTALGKVQKAALAELLVPPT
jgi:fatty-acyl-CoA synthase